MLLQCAVSNVITVCSVQCYYSVQCPVLLQCAMSSVITVHYGTPWFYVLIFKGDRHVSAITSAIRQSLWWVQTIRQFRSVKWFQESGPTSKLISLPLEARVLTDFSVSRTFRSSTLLLSLLLLSNVFISLSIKRTQLNSSFSLWSSFFLIIHLLFVVFFFCTFLRKSGKNLGFLVAVLLVGVLVLVCAFYPFKLLKL